MEENINEILQRFFIYNKEKHGEKGILRIAENDEAFDKYFTEFLNENDQTFDASFLSSLHNELNKNAFTLIEHEETAKYFRR
jgi:hypothetical protein